MTMFDYQESRSVEREGFPFYALIMAAMRQADTDNLTRLQVAFPDVWNELNARYHSPGGLLPEEREEDSKRGAVASNFDNIVFTQVNPDDDATGTVNDNDPGRVIDLMQALKDSLAKER